MANILFAEDDEVLYRTFLLVVKKDAKHQIRSAMNGSDALKLFNEQQPDIIVTDLMMPEMDGVDFIAKIKEVNDTIPIIVTSALSENDFKLINISDTSNILYFPKPYSNAKLLEKVNELTA